MTNCVAGQPRLSRETRVQFPTYRQEILDSIVVSVPARHAEDLGSIPGGGDLILQEILTSSCKPNCF